MRSSVWRQVVQTCADPQRARHFGEQLQAAAPSVLRSASLEQARLLAVLFSGSQALSEALVAHPDWLAMCLDLEAMRQPRREQGLRREVQAWLKPPVARRDAAAVLHRLREFKQREMLRIAARDLSRLGVGSEITRELSTVADLCLDLAYQACRQQFSERFGEPYHLDAEDCWRPTPFSILGLGKLGGQELNYSSDIDLMFVYGEEGWVFKDPPKRGAPGGRGLSNHQFFQRLIEMLVSELTRLAPEGMLFRVDLRLRPEGDAGPLARSLDSYESYYAQWGQTWERMMLTKARGVAGDPALTAEFLEMVQPFRYPRSMPDRILRDVAEMKGRIETEVVRSGEIERNVKLGRGGIREIEFIVQTLQLLHAGRMPFVQGAQTLPVLDKMAQYRLLRWEDVQALAAAYGFLRDVEHRLQMENNLQTHTIPADRKARDRLAALMGYDSLHAFEHALKEHTTRVRECYDALVNVEPADTPLPLPPDFEGAEATWKQLLASHAFRQVDKSFGVIRTFVEGPGYGHVSPRTRDLARQLLLQLFSLCPQREAAGQVRLPRNALSDPDRVVARLDTYVAAYGARAMLYETWAGNPSFFELLVLLFDRSEFLAETAIRAPDLVENLAQSGLLRRRKNTGQILEDLRHGWQDDNQQLWVRRYHQAELMRLGLRDIVGLADFEQNLVELSGLADACLQYGLEVVSRKHKLTNPPLAIVGLGKLGGAELTYGSDLDVTFVADSRVKNLSTLQRVAADLIELLSRRTEHGLAFVVDARLRPDGEKGLLVNTLKAYEEYYRHRAMLWEIQALSRNRSLAGDPKVGAQFQALAAELTDFTQPKPGVAAYRPDWRKQVAAMRARIEKERTPPGKNPLAIKTGTGGLVDAEFIAQAFCLAHGWQEANTVRALQRAAEAQVLPPADADDLLERYRKLRRIEGILRRWSFEGETVLPDEPAPLYRVAVRCGYPDAEAFMQAVGEHRAVIRSVYNKVFAPG